VVMASPSRLSCREKVCEEIRSRARSSRTGSGHGDKAPKLAACLTHVLTSHIKKAPARLRRRLRFFRPALGMLSKSVAARRNGVNDSTLNRGPCHSWTLPSFPKNVVAGLAWSPPVARPDPLTGSASREDPL
jgi:hypothetical protein